jgi:uncharacterized repeat protein (TIGR01451 family)
MLVVIGLVPATVIPLGQRADAGAFPGLNGKIAFASSNPIGTAEIYVMNDDGSAQTRVTNDPASDFDPSWSPDGSKIAFTSDRDGNSEIYVMNANGSAQTRLTNESSRDEDPSWSPDGTKIAFTSDRDGNSEVYVMNASGSARTRLTDDTSSDEDPSWSPDGTKIAFMSGRDGNAEIYLMNANGSDQTRLTNDPNFDGDPSWSPDGSKMAFVSLRDGNRDIYSMNANGSARTRLTNDPNFDGDPAWSPDGAKIAFSSVRELSRDIFVMNADGSAQTRLANVSVFDSHPDWQTIPSADLALSMGATPDSVTPGQELTYTITVRNNGPSNAQGVVVTDPLPSDSRFRSVTTTKGSCTHPEVDETGTVRCVIGFLPNSGVQSAQIVVRFIIEDTTVTNRATVSSLTPDPNPANNSVTLSHRVGSARADLSAALGAKPNPVRNGQNLTYTATVRNLGPDQAFGVTLTHKLPGGVQFQSATPSQGTCTKPAVGGTGTISCALGALASGATATLKVVVRVVTSNTTLTSSATVAGSTTDPNTANNQATAKAKVCGFLFC